MLSSPSHDLGAAENAAPNVPAAENPSNADSTRGIPIDGHVVLKGGSTAYADPELTPLARDFTGVTINNIPPEWIEQVLTALKQDVSIDPERSF
ncbi:hypothetical protein GCM10027046_26160 [Uliginosibacterium flavum]